MDRTKAAYKLKDFFLTGLLCLLTLWEVELDFLENPTWNSFRSAMESTVNQTNPPKVKVNRHPASSCKNQHLAHLKGENQVSYVWPRKISASSTTNNWEAANFSVFSYHFTVQSSFARPMAIRSDTILNPETKPEMIKLKPWRIRSQRITNKTCKQICWGERFIR